MEFVKFEQTFLNFYGYSLRYSRDLDFRLRSLDDVELVKETHALRSIYSQNFQMNFQDAMSCSKHLMNTTGFNQTALWSCFLGDVV